MKLAQIPAMIHPHLDCLDHDKDGGLFLGASSLAGRYWTGSLWYFEDGDTAPNWEKCAAGAELHCGVTDLRVCRDNHVLLATDSGAIHLWQLNKGENTLGCLAQPQEHDDIVTSVSVSSDQTRALSASRDKRIKVWDLEECVATYTYKAHWDQVHCVSCHPTEPDLFVSCSQDGRVLMWDIRKSKPASIVDISSLGILPSTVAWQPGSMHSIAVGSNSGTICVQDVRTNIGTPLVVVPHQRAVHRIAFHPQESHWLASVGEDCKVVVTDVGSESAQIIYEDNEHKDFVQGLSWKPNSQHLYTSGWDFKVRCHNITASMATRQTKANETSPVPQRKESSNGDMETSSPQKCLTNGNAC